MGLWVVPGFAEERELGTGGSGRVVAAVHVASGTRVAIKYLSARLLGDPRFVAAFRSEAAILRTMQSPQVVRLLDYVEAPGQGAAIVMELVDGVSLHELITRQGPTGAESALLVLKGSLQGLAAAHALGVVHGDYKPENVLVDSSGQSRLSDFGVAARSGQAASGGTPLYMAPEQWNGAPASPAADIYAACAVFFECLTGMTPFSGSVTQLAAQHAVAAIPVELVDEPLRPMIARGMAKSPADRPADAARLMAELQDTAAAAYGADWEDRARGQLAGRAAALLLLLLPHGGAAVGAGAGTATASTWLPATTAARAGLGGWQVATLYAGLFVGAFAIVGGTLIGISAARGGQPAPHGATVTAAVTATDLLSAPVPASCGHRAGRLSGGVLPGVAANDGVMELAWLADPHQSPQAANEAFGDLTGDQAGEQAGEQTGDRSGDAAAVLFCDAGGVAWPEIIAFYAPGPRLLAWAYLTAFNLPGMGQDDQNAFVHRIAYQAGGVYAEWSTQDNGDAAAYTTLDYSATLKLAGGKIRATSLVGVTERPTVTAFASDLRAGHQAAADRLAAPRVGEQAAGLFRSYPSALDATPVCYGLIDPSLPAPLASLVTSGGPDQVSQDTDRLCAFPSTDPGASWVALGLQQTGWRSWRVLWAQSVSLPPAQPSAHQTGHASRAAVAASAAAPMSASMPRERSARPVATTARTALSGKALGPMCPIRSSLPDRSPCPPDSSTPD